MTKYDVIRAHTGEKDYAVGDTRIAEERVVRHLIGKCLIEAKTARQTKAAKALLNKSSD